MRRVTGKTSIMKKKTRYTDISGEQAHVHILRPSQAENLKPNQVKIGSTSTNKTKFGVYQIALRQVKRFNQAE